MFSKVTLLTAMQVLRDTYRSIDIRAVLVKSFRDNRWYTPFIKIRPTIQEKSELRMVYQEKMSIGFKNNDQFKIVFEPRSISELDKLFQEVQDMRIKIGSIELKPIGLDSQNIFDSDRYLSYGSSYYITEKENEIYQHRLLFTTMDKNVEATIESLGSNLKSQGLQIGDLNSFLDTSNINLTNNVVIIFPIYCKKSPQLKTELKNYIARYLIHESLVDQSKYNLTVRDGTNLIHTKSQNLNEIANYGKEFAEINIPRPKKILANYAIELQIRHGILGAIIADKLTVSYKFPGKSSKSSYRKMGQLTKRSGVTSAGTSSTLISRKSFENRNVFIIHGHDMTPPLQLQKLLKDEWNIDSIILMNKPGKGRTIIEKFEEEAKKASYAFAILTPDDIINAKENQYLQARPNVIFELGWFYGRVGRDRVCIMLKEGTIIHSDLAGVSRIQFKESICEKVLEIRDELKNQSIIL